MLDETEKWQCPRCNTLVNCSKKIDIWKLPPILVITLKRFAYNTTGDKISSEIVCPIKEFNLRRHVSSP